MRACALHGRVADGGALAGRDGHDTHRPLDRDDTFEPLGGHATAVLVPAILALGEELDSAGPELVEALVVGLEVMACVGRGANPRHYRLGWHATSTIGAIGAAGAAARLLKPDAQQANDAPSLAVSLAAGTRMQLGADARSAHAGLAAKSGILGATHLSLDGLLALRAREGFAAEDIEAIGTALPVTLRRNLMHDDPRTGMQARLSMTCCPALAAVQGAVGPADFEGDAIFRPAPRALMPRIRMQPLEEPEGAPPPAAIDAALGMIAGLGAGGTARHLVAALAEG